MSDERKIQHVLVTLPDVIDGQVEGFQRWLQEELSHYQVSEHATVRPAPQLWVLAVVTPDLPRPSVTVHATEASAVMYLRDWTEKLPAYVPDEEVADWLATHSDIWATIERLDYPVASAYVG